VLKRILGKLDIPIRGAIVLAGCYGISARAEAAGRTPLQQFDEEGQQDMRDDAKLVKESFVDSIVDFGRVPSRTLFTHRAILPFVTM
jgi:hypothetical protein